MAGKGFDQRQGNIDPWERCNNQNERFNPWMNQEDGGGPMRREHMEMDMDRSRNQMGTMRGEMDDPTLPDWYDDEDFLEERFVNEGRMGGNFTGPEHRTVRRAVKRQKTQQRYEEMADSRFQNELMNHQEVSQKRAREKDYARDGIGGPYTEPVWDRPDASRDNYYHKPSMGMGDGGRDRNTMRYEDGLQSRPSPNYNFDFTDKGGANMPTVPVTSSWNKPVPAGAENVVIPLAKKKKKKKSGTSPNWNGPGNNNPGHSGPFDLDSLHAKQRPIDSTGESLYTRRPRQLDDQVRHDDEMRSNWDNRDRPVSNMEVYRMRMAAQASQSEHFKRRDEDSVGSHFMEKPDHSNDKHGDIIGAQSTHSIDSDEFLYQDKPAPQRSSVDEPKNMFWENLNKSFDERKEKEKENAPKQASSIGDVLVESLLKHISQKVDSGKHVGSSLQKEEGKSTDLAQQLMDLLSNASAESRPKEELKEEQKPEHVSFENRPYQSEAVANYTFNRQDDSRMYPANPMPLPESLAPVSSGASFSATSNYSSAQEYPAASVQYPYPHHQPHTPLQPPSQLDYHYGQGSVAPQMQSTYIPQAVPPPLMAPPVMHHPMAPQPVPPPVISPMLPRTHMPLMFPNFSAMQAPSPAPFLPSASMRFGMLGMQDKKNRMSRWGSNNNNQRRAILTPIPKKVDKRNDKSAAVGVPDKSGKNLAPAARQQSTPSTSSKNFVTSSHKGGLDRFRSVSSKPVSSSLKGSSSTSKSASKEASSTSKSQISSSKDGVSTSRDGGSALKDGSSASKDTSSSKSGNSASKDSAASKNSSSTLKDTKPSKDASVSSHSSKHVKPVTIPIPKSIEERSALEEQELLLRKQVELLRAELRRLRTKCSNIMANLSYKERLTDPKLNEAKKLESEMKAQFDSTNKEYQAMSKALKASFHLVENAMKERACAKLMSDDKVTTTPTNWQLSYQPKTKTIVLNLKPAAIASAVGTELKILEAPGTGVTTKHYRFTDNGDHWCKHCDIILPVADDMLRHVQRKHYDVMQHVPPEERPWAEKPPECKMGPGEKLTHLPFRGVEFMIPCDSFFCNLCKELFGDLCTARCHLESLKHNANYSKFCKSNPNYAKHIQSVINAEKKQGKKNKDKDSPAEKSQHGDINILRSMEIKKEPEVIDIDDDDADNSAAGKQSPKSAAISEKKNSSLTTNISEKEISIVADVDEPEQASSNSGKASKDNNEKGKGGNVAEKANPSVLDSNASNEEMVAGSNPEKSFNVKADASETESKNAKQLEPALSSAMDAELTTEKGSQQESSKPPETSKDSANKSKEENVFENVSDDEMAEEQDNLFEMVTDDELTDEDAAKKINAGDVDQATEDMEMKGTIFAENIDNADANCGDDTIEDFCDDALVDDADITIVDEADGDDVNDDSAEVVIEEDADENNAAEECAGVGNTAEDNAAEENDCTVIPDDEEEVIDNADEESESADNVDDGLGNGDEEDEVIHFEEEMCADAADKEYVAADIAAEEDEVAGDAVEEDDVVDDAVEEDEVIDNAVEDDKVAGDAVEEDEVAGAAVEETASDAVEEDEATGDAVEEDEATGDAVEEDEATGDAVEEDEATGDAVEGDEAAGDAVEEDEVAEAADKDEEIDEADDKENEVADNVDKGDKDLGTITTQEENADNAAEEVAHTGSVVKDSVDEECVAQEDAKTDELIKENLDKVLEMAVVDNIAENMATGHDIDKDVASAAVENVDSGDITEENAATVDSKEVTNNVMQEGNVILSVSDSNKVDVPQGTMKRTAKILGDHVVASVDFPTNILDSVSLDPKRSSRNSQEKYMDKKKSDSSKTADRTEHQDKSADLQTSNSTEISQNLLQKMAVDENDADPKAPELDSSSGLYTLLEPTSDNSASNLGEETLNSKEDPECPPNKRRQVAICSRGRGRGAPRGRGRADASKDTQQESTLQNKLQAKAGGEGVSSESIKKITPSKYTRGAKPETPAPTRVGRRSSRQTAATVAKAPEVETPSRPRRQPPRAKPVASGVKRDKSGRPVRGKTSLEEISEDDVIDLESPQQGISKKYSLPEVIETEAKFSSQVSGGRCRRKVTPRRAELQAAEKAVQKVEDDANAEKPEAAEAVPWQITEIVTLDEEETNKLMWSTDASLGMGRETKNQGLVEPEKMETSMFQEGDESSNVVELSADEDDAKIEKMEAILLGDPCINSPELDEADDACLESDLEIVDEAEDTD